MKNISKVVRADQFDFDWFKQIQIQKRKKGNPGTRNKIKYLDIITAFDIETSKLNIVDYVDKKFLIDKDPDYENWQSFMYIWAYQIGLEYTVIGRTWDEFLNFTYEIERVTKEGVRLCTFVHNLSYEFQFLRGIYQFEKDEVFALDKRKVLKCSMHDSIEFRCSYLHSNMSLKQYTEKMGAEHSKLSGEDFDYNEIRFPWTTLTKNQHDYVQYDVLGLVEAIMIEMEHDNDNIYTFPLTSTGYVRRNTKKAMRQVSHMYVKNQLPDYEIYKMLREAFRGGNTHANRFYAGTVLQDVKSADMTSAYPYAQCNCLFPVSQFFRAGAVTFKELIELINVRKKAVVMRVSMTNVRLRDKYWGFPYIPRDKTRQVRKPVIDNGRILEAEYLEMTITDVDLRIILQEYDYDDFVPMDVAHARYGKLPPSLIEETIKYFRGKTELKKVKGIAYDKFKNLLNAIYGMSAQDPVKQSVDFIHNEFIEAEDEPEELLMKSNKKAFLAYQWGVWITAWARLRLEEGLQLAGDNGVYCDTDSVKYLGDIDWEPNNKKRIQESLESGSHALDTEGVEYYMGVFEYEGCYEEFCTLGAKKYAYRQHGELITTVAGVAKVSKNGRLSGGEELEKNGGIESFKAGFEFEEAGGTQAIYNDNPDIEKIVIDGNTIPITSNVVLKDGVYTLGITAEYKRLLKTCNKLFDI